MKNASLCYIERGGKYLMLLRNKKPDDPNEGKWIGVGGKLEPGESPADCARREIREETGLTALDLISFGRVYFKSDVWEEEIMHLFLVTDFEGELISDEESREGTLEWVPYDKVLSKPTWEGDYEIFKWILDDVPFFSAKFTYDDQQRLVDKSVTFYDNK